MIINFNNNSFTFEGLVWNAPQIPVGVSYYIIDVVNGIIYFHPVVVAECEYDGAFSGTCVAPPRVSGATYNGTFNGIINLTYYSQLEYDGVFSGSVLVSRPSSCSYTGFFSGAAIVTSVASPCEYDGQFSGIVIPLANVASEACISGPGNPVVVPQASLMF